MDDGETAQFGPDDVFDIPPGHDAWVVGNETVVALDVLGYVGAIGVPGEHERLVTTLLMSDIVDSTLTATKLGDTAWTSPAPTFASYFSPFVQLDGLAARGQTPTG